MRLSTLALLCVFILACTGLMRSTARRLCVAEGSIAALSVLLLAVSAFSPAVSAHISLNLAFCLTLLLGLLLCRGLPDIADALLIAVCTGALGFAVYSMFPNFYEPGFLAGLPAALVSSQLFRRRRTALLSAAAAPLFFSLCVMFEEMYLFDSANLRLGDPVVLDAQMSSILLLFLLWHLPRLQLRRPHAAQ